MRERERMAAKKRGFLHTLRRNWISVAFAMLSLSLFSYPAVSSVITQWRQHDYVQGARSAVDESADPKRLQQLANAVAYNDKLLDNYQVYNEGLGGGHSSEEDIVPSTVEPQMLDYSKQLDWKPSGVISVVEIPTLAIELPIFHGTSDSVLSMGAGHVESSALPIGGLGSRCAISGHSGLRTARMFDDIRELKEGDLIILRTLGDTYAYSVCQIDDMVEPEELPYLLEPVEGRDLISLFTCTPYGVNSHRYVVTAERTKYVPNDPSLDFNVGKVLVNDMTKPLIIALCVAFLVWLVTIFVARRRIYVALLAADNANKLKAEEEFKEE